MMGVTIGAWIIGGDGDMGRLAGGAMFHLSPASLSDLLKVIGGVGVGGSGMEAGSDSGAECWGSRLTGAGGGMVAGAGAGIVI